MANVKKGLVAIASEILEDVQNESEKIIREAETRAKEILKQAKTEAEKRHADSVAEAKQKSEQEYKKTKSLTAIEIRNIHLQAKEEQLSAVFDEAVARLKKFVDSKNYSNYLLSFVEEAAKNIESDRLVIYVNSKDQKSFKTNQLEDLSKKLDKKLTLSTETIECMGGCIVKTPDGKLSHDNTFENRLQVLKPNIRVKLEKMLFQEA
jgi:V/A-type H+/Na+-transporting ATPase subunit E